MRIFLSHSSRDKPLIRELRSNLPQHVRAWIDEDDLLFGENIESSLKNAISLESDFVIIFIGRESVRSEWVKKELRWALRHEKKIGRTFVLPVLLDEELWEQVEPKEFRSRKYLLCTDFSEAGVRAFSERLKDELFAWVSRHLDVARESRPNTPIIVVETLVIDMSANAYEDLKQQGAPPEALEQFQELFQDFPEHALVVRVRNEGTGSVLLTGFGIVASQEGKRDFRKYPYSPTVDEQPWMQFEPGDYHEFIMDLADLGHELKNPIIQYRGKAYIRGFYQGYDGTDYPSESFILDLDTLEVEYL